MFSITYQPSPNSPTTTTVFCGTTAQFCAFMDKLTREKYTGVYTITGRMRDGKDVALDLLVSLF